jgi:hypothetical protein
MSLKLDPGRTRERRTGATTTVRPRGQELPQSLRHRMETQFGADFSAVRVHEGHQATHVGAVAYSQGHDLHFAPGAYDPTSTAGQELIGHELAHVVQQQTGRVATAVPRGMVRIGEHRRKDRPPSADDYDDGVSSEISAEGSDE